MQIRYPPTIEIRVGNGPSPASVYCASPPVVFGISAFNSESEAMVVIFKRQAITIANINTTPTVPAPCPSETRQLVVVTRPTAIDTTLLSPNLFFINAPPSICISSYISASLLYRASIPSSPVRTRITFVIS